MYYEGGGLRGGGLVVTTMLAGKRQAAAMHDVAVDDKAWSGWQGVEAHSGQRADTTGSPVLSLATHEPACPATSVTSGWQRRNARVKRGGVVSGERASTLYSGRLIELFGCPKHEHQPFDPLSCPPQPRQLRYGTLNTTPQLAPTFGHTHPRSVYFDSVIALHFNSCPWVPTLTPGLAQLLSLVQTNHIPKQKTL
ncbi:hypothetical protein BDV93DRAFT_510963 [Ceratobasidium sp. AG-I]|nr:hypothetical protein BDV93DRAFT_510963 [Ceratobasidium sp. AG-I]